MGGKRWNSRKGEQADVETEPDADPNLDGEPMSSSEAADSTTQPFDDEKPSEKRALMKYREHHGLGASVEVTKEMVEESAEGLGWWACHGLELGTRSNIGQCFSRAMSWEPDMKEIYGELDFNLKERFRAEYTLHGSFDFATKIRKHSLSDPPDFWKTSLFHIISFCGSCYLCSTP
jgi:hypothetical protein